MKKYKYICPLCGQIADPKDEKQCFLVKTSYERRSTVVHKICYEQIKKRGQK